MKFYTAIITKKAKDVLSDMDNISESIREAMRIAMNDEDGKVNLSGEPEYPGESKRVGFRCDPEIKRAFRKFCNMKNCSMKEVLSKYIIAVEEVENDRV